MGLWYAKSLRDTPARISRSVWFCICVGALWKEGRKGGKAKQDLRTGRGKKGRDEVIET